MAARGRDFELVCLAAALRVEIETLLPATRKTRSVMAEGIER
jgi:hypothetical protein